MKKIICAVMIAVIICVVYGFLHHGEYPVKSDIPAETETVTETSSDEVKGITPEQAEKLCYNVMGEKDDATGFPFLFRNEGMVCENGKQYYLIRASWLVNNSHFSYIGDFFVSADGKQVYSGISEEGENVISGLIWSE